MQGLNGASTFLPAGCRVQGKCVCVSDMLASKKVTSQPSNPPGGRNGCLWLEPCERGLNEWKRRIGVLNGRTLVPFFGWR